jgi:hypothetical protein
MNKSFWGFIWERFSKHHGVLIGFIALLSAMIFWNFAPDKSVRLGIVIPFGIIFIILLIVFGDTAYVSFKTNRNILPGVICVKPYLKNNKEIHLFLLTPSDLFSNDILVSFYYCNDEYEQLIGIGKVFNIQDDNKIQVLLLYPLEGHEEKVKEMVKNNKLYLDKTKIKPNIPYSML